MIPVRKKNGERFKSPDWMNSELIEKLTYKKIYRKQKQGLIINNSLIAQAPRDLVKQAKVQTEEKQKYSEALVIS